MNRLVEENDHVHYLKSAILPEEKKGRDLTQTYDKNPSTDRQRLNAKWQHKKTATKTFDYITTAHQLRTVSWSDDIQQTGVVKPVYRIPTFQLTIKAL